MKNLSKISIDYTIDNKKYIIKDYQDVKIQSSESNKTIYGYTIEYRYKPEIEYKWKCHNYKYEKRSSIL